MNQLDTILLILDPFERERALVDYARNLGIEPLQAKKSNGRHSEERLVLLIYDALQAKKEKRKKNFIFLGGGLLVGTGGIALIFFFPQWLNIAYQESRPEIRPTANVMRAYDAAGKPLMEDGQPVLFEPMQGSYFEYDAQGRPQYEYFYKNGQLVARKDFDTKGRVIREEKFRTK